MVEAGGKSQERAECANKPSECPRGRGVGQFAGVQGRDSGAQTGGAERRRRRSSAGFARAALGELVRRKSRPLCRESGRSLGGSGRSAGGRRADTRKSARERALRGEAGAARAKVVKFAKC